MKRVLIIEAQIKQYRVPFYEGLRTELNGSGIELRVGYSDPNPAEASKQDTSDLPCDYSRKVRGYWLLRNKLLFQPLLSAALTADLVIVDQANKLLLNHCILPLSRCGAKRVAFWGHGTNGREDRSRLSEWYRRYTLNWVSWWFAYTRSTAKYLVEHGVPAPKITVVDNAIDTNKIREQVRRESLEERLALRARLSIPASAPVAIYCGGLDEIKKIPLLINSAKLVQVRIPDFHLLLVGGGPERSSVESAIKELPWIHSLGPQFGGEKSKLMAISDVLLIPGAVGLVILDAFAAGLPLLSTRLSIHGPEMEYLEEGINGLLSEPDVAAFANMTASLLQNRQSLERLQQGSRESGSKYTIENMVINFKKGIESCLGRRGSHMSLLKNGIA